MATSRLHLLRRTLILLHSSSPPPFLQLSPFSAPHKQYKFKHPLGQFSSLSMEESTSSSPIQSEIREKAGRNSKWKPMCLYYTQDKCTMMDDPLHLEKFCHKCSVDLGEIVPVDNVRAQEFDYFLVLDLEGKVEILEFSVLLFDAKTMDVVDVFHRFVRPTQMSEKRINEYVLRKYGAFGVDRVWHDTATTFEEVIGQFENWLRKERDGHIKLWRDDGDGRLHDAAFVTCGNWDLKTKVPQQCEDSGMMLPRYFMEWINLKDIYINFYTRRAPGMLSMMRELRIPPLGSHHLGIDDSKNIARVMRRLLSDGAILQITARRIPGSANGVRFFLRNRIK